MKTKEIKNYADASCRCYAVQKGIIAFIKTLFDAISVINYLSLLNTIMMEGECKKLSAHIEGKGKGVTPERVDCDVNSGG